MKEGKRGKRDRVLTLTFLFLIVRTYESAAVEKRALPPP